MTVTLQQLVDGARARVDRDRARMPEREVHARLSDQEPRPGARMRLALGTPELGVIAEVKGASPVAGVLREQLDPRSLARAYADSGAVALSVLTEERFFAGSLEHLRQVVGAVTCPVVRKDFIVDDYQIAQAALAGAAAVLLIAEALSSQQLVDLVGTAHELRLDALVEIHGPGSLVAAIEAGSGLIGVNNRDLETMKVDWRHCLRMADDLPVNVLKVAESGLAEPEQVAAVAAAGYDAVLVGTSLVTASDPGAALRRLLGEAP